MNKFINTLLTILHLTIMFGFFALAFVVDLRWVVLIWLIVEIHLIIFNGCIVTIIQQKTGGVPKDTEFIPYCAKKLTKTDITETQHEILSAAFLYGPVIIALVRAFA